MFPNKALKPCLFPLLATVLLIGYSSEYCLANDDDSEEPNEKTLDRLGGKEDSGSTIQTPVSRSLESSIVKGLSKEDIIFLEEGYSEIGDNLTDFSVRLDCKPRRVPIDRYTICLSKKSVKPESWDFLTRPGNPRIISVLKTNSDNMVVLNPKRYFLYPGLPHLDGITEEQARILWGNSTRKKEVGIDYCCFKLTSKKLQKRGPIFLDVEFKDGRIARYRVRIEGVGGAKWNPVDGTDRRKREEY